MRGVLEGDGPLAHGAGPAVADGGGDGAVGLQLAAQADAAVPGRGVPGAALLRARLHDAARTGLGDGVLQGGLSHRHVYAVVLVQQLGAGHVLRERHTAGGTTTSPQLRR